MSEATAAQSLARLRAFVQTHLRDAFEYYNEAEDRYVDYMAKHRPAGAVVAPMLAREHRENVRRVQVQPCSLMIVGSNSAGKSTLVNALLSWKDGEAITAKKAIVPAKSGYASKRIVRFTYVPIDDAKITFARFTANGLLPLPNQDETAHVKISDMAKEQGLISQLAAGTAKDPKPTDDDYKQWTETVIEVHYPFDFLKPGIDLYDTPGTSISDQADVQTSLRAFWAHVRAVPVFVYANPSFADAETPCFRQLQQALPLDGFESMNVMFVNTYFDSKSVRNDYGVDDDVENLPPDVIAVEIQRRYKMLLASAVVSDVVKLPHDLAACDRFACVGAMEVDKRGDAGVRALFLQLIERLHRFAASSQRERVLGALQMLLFATKHFNSQLVESDRKALTVAEIDQRKQHAVTVIKTRLTDLDAHVTKQLNEFTAALRLRCEDELLRQQAQAAAAKVELSAYEGHAVNSSAQGAFREVFHKWVQTNVFEPAVRDLLMRIRQHEITQINKLAVDDNKDIVEALTLKLNLTGSTVELKDSKQFKVGRQIVQLATAVARTLASFVVNMTSVQVVDRNFKEALALTMLDEIMDPKTPVVNESFIAAVKEEARRFLQDLSDLVETHYQQKREMASLNPLDRKQLVKLRPYFASAECHIVARFFALETPIEPTIDLNTEQYYGYANQHRGLWYGREVIVRHVPFSLNAVSLRGFYDDVHFGWTLSLSTARDDTVVPLLRRVSQSSTHLDSRERRGTNTGMTSSHAFATFHALYVADDRWILVTSPFDWTMDVFLQKRVANIPMEVALTMALHASKGVSLMHYNGHTHGELATRVMQVKSYRMPGREHAAAVTGDDSASYFFTHYVEAVIGNYGASYSYDDTLTAAAYRTELDIVALGRIIFELMPKKDYVTLPPKPTAATADEALQLINTLANAEVRDIVTRCYLHKPEACPTADDISIAINDILHGRLNQPRPRTMPPVDRQLSTDSTTSSNNSAKNLSDDASPVPSPKGSGELLPKPGHTKSMFLAERRANRQGRATFEETNSEHVYQEGGPASNSPPSIVVDSAAASSESTASTASPKPAALLPFNRPSGLPRLRPMSSPAPFPGAT